MHCIQCGGPAGVLGTLGATKHYQCRNCGWQWSRGARRQKPKAKVQLDPPEGETSIPDGEVWPQMMERIKAPRMHHQIPREVYDYFLGVLPPVRRLGNGFVFADGYNPWRLFYQHDGKYWVRSLTLQETRVYAEATA
jgi:hypothetical protein